VFAKTREYGADVAAVAAIAVRLAAVVAAAC